MMSEESRQCYICLDEEGGERDWVSPCRCAGSLKWVHQRCIIRWVREHETAQPMSPAACGQCRTPLRMVPKKGALVAIMEYMDKTVYPVCKYMAGWFYGLLVFDAVGTTFGIFTQSQVYGLDETLATVSESDKFSSMIRLHLTAFALVFLNSVSWERYLLKGLRRLSRLPGGKWFLPEEVPVRLMLRKESSVSRTTAVSTVLLPFFANQVGNVCFSSVDSKLDRVLLGGLTFLGVKGVLSMFLLQKREVHRKRMTVTPYQTNAPTQTPQH